MPVGLAKNRVTGHQLSDPHLSHVESVETSKKQTSAVLSSKVALCHRGYEYMTHDCDSWLSSVMNVSHVTNMCPLAILHTQSFDLTS